VATAAFALALVPAFIRFGPGWAQQYATGSHGCVPGTQFAFGKYGFLCYPSSPTPAPSGSPTPTPSPSLTPTPTPTSTPSGTPSPTPTASPSPSPTPGIPSIAAVSYNSNSLVSGGNMLINAPTIVSTGDLLMGIISGATGTITPPTGWVGYYLIPASGNSPSVDIFEKRGTSSDAGSVYTFSDSVSTDALNMEILDITGTVSPSTTNIFWNYTTPAATTIGSSSSIPTMINALPIAVSAIHRLLPSNAGIPSSITAGWTGLSLVVDMDSSNYNNTANNNGLNAMYLATGPSATSLSTPVIANWTWGGASSTFTGTSAMILVDPAAVATPTPSPTPTASPSPTPSPTPTASPSPTTSPTAAPTTTPAIVTLSSGSNALAGGNTVAVTAPSGVVAGNLLLGIASSGTETWTAPGGWTLYGTEPASGNSPQISVFTKIATASEPSAYDWTSSNGVDDATNIAVLNISGENQVTPINGMFSKYTTTAAVGIGTSGVSIPTVLQTLPIAVNAIYQINLSNVGWPSGLTAGWASELGVWNEDPSNYGNSSNTNGYNALYTASGPITASTSASVTAGWTWGGAYSNFSGTSVMLFINPGFGASPTPTPSPTATPTGTPTPTAYCAPPFSAPLEYPSDCYQPYATSSVWNTPISSYSSVSADPNGPGYTSYYLAHGGMFNQGLNFGYKSRANQYQHPIYFGHSSDPSDTVSAGCGWSNCANGMSFHIPSYALPAGGGDSHLGVVDESTTAYDELDCWGASAPSGGSIHATSCSYTTLAGSGIMFGVTGAGFALWGGVIRDQELIAGQINHALFIDATCSSNASVYPSETRSSDAYCSAGAPYGGWLRLNMTDAQILALGAPAYKVPIYMALAHYGAFLGDNNNTTVYIHTEADEMYTAAGYTSSGCSGLPSGAPCTPLTAWMHQNYSDAGWDGTAYRINLNEVNWATYGQWLLPPP